MKRIVAQAFAGTGAKGVALALRSRPGTPVVCCASEGEMAPPPGSPLDESSGFTAECLRKGSFIVCEDSETDPRVDRDVCARLGVRSIVAVPVEKDGATVGILEALSDQQAAFSKQHIELLLTLACFAKSVAGGPEVQTHAHSVPAPLAAAASQPATPRPQASAVAETDLLAKVDDSRSWTQRVPRRVRLAIAGGVAAALLLALFATAILLWMWRQNASAEVGKTTKPEPQQAVYPKPAAGLAVNSSHKPATRPRTPGDGKSVVVKASSVEKILSPAPAREVSETASEPAVEDAVAPEAFTPISKETTRQLTAALSSGESLPMASVATSQGVTPARLQHRVEPIYPPDAKRLRIEGPVVLRAAIDESGNVKSVGVVKGSPLLASAAMAAVRQWRYAPSELNHRPTASTTDITIVFHLQ